MRSRPGSSRDCYSGVRGINALLAPVNTDASARIIVEQRLRRGACGSPRGAARMVRDALATINRLNGMASADVLLRADSAFYSHATMSAAINEGAAVSVTARMDPAVKRAIAAIPDNAREAIEYTDAFYDEATKTWTSAAEVAEIPSPAQLPEEARADHRPPRGAPESRS